MILLMADIYLPFFFFFILTSCLDLCVSLKWQCQQSHIIKFRYVKRDLNLLCQARNDAEIDVVNVDLSDRTYPIYIGESILQHGELLQKHVTSKKAMIVTNTKVGPLYSTGVRDVLERKGVEVFEVVLPDGEEYKTMDILMKIIDAAMLAKLDRKSTLIALGGGVIGDMTGVLMCYITFSLCIVILMSTSFFFQQNYL